MRNNTDYAGALGRWCSLMLLLTGENIGFRHRRTRLAVLLAVLEPMGIIAIFSISHSLLNRAPPFGTSNMLFFTTGILPYYLFFHVSWRARSWDYLQPMPRVTKFDQLVSHVLSELLTKIFFLTIVYLALFAHGVDQAIPVRPLDCLFALMTLAALGVGVGMVNAVIAGFFYAWLYVYAIVMRGWIMFSGVLFVMDWTPPALREVAILNPLSHAITWYRWGQYEGYPTLTLDLKYLFFSTAGIVAVGWLVENFTRPWRSVR